MIKVKHVRWSVTGQVLKLTALALFLYDGLTNTEASQILAAASKQSIRSSYYTDSVCMCMFTGRREPRLTCHMDQLTWVQRHRRNKRSSRELLQSTVNIHVKQEECLSLNQQNGKEKFNKLIHYNLRVNDAIFSSKINLLKNYTLNHKTFKSQIKWFKYTFH